MCFPAILEKIVRMDINPGKIRKRSVRIAGHATSISLEAAFWEALKRIADDRGCSINRLITDIDLTRATDGSAGNLSSAIRVFVLGQARRS